MFVNHEFSGFDFIDLYIKFQPNQQTEIVNAPSEVEDVNEQESPSIIPKEDVEEDDVEEENETQVDHCFTSLFEEGEGGHVELEVEHTIPVDNVFCPPPT